MKAAAIIPCYNVGALCAPVLEETRKYVDAIIAVNDGSTDDTAVYLSKAAVEVLTHERNAGKGVALITAFEHFLSSPDFRDYDTVLTLDGDGQHNPNEIRRLLDAYAANPDSIIVGTREVDRPDIGFRHRWGNIISRYFISKACGQYIPDTQSGFRVFSREALRAIKPHLRPGRYETETAFLILAARAGYRVVPIEISTIYTDETERVSSFNPYLDTYLVFKVVARSILFGK
ncbi:MAG: glycosyltransferase family 2 protein [Candidatus Lindowbacteria bacterium]|nr:glycosyltransferase family 2 protein [Candidatus Lindowbacteria bacterium]